MNDDESREAAPEEVESIFEALQAEEKHAFLMLDADDAAEWNHEDESVRAEFRTEVREECAREATDQGFSTLLICDPDDNVLCIGCREEEDVWGFLELADDSQVQVNDIFGEEEEEGEEE